MSHTYTTSVLRVFATIFLTSAASACIDPPPANNQATPGTDMMGEGQMLDMPADMTDTPGDEADMPADTDAEMDEPDADSNNAMTCEPTLAQCPEDVCGVVDNGCGEELDCGTCACNDGVEVLSVCGPCGVGRTVCRDGESGVGECELPPLDDQLLQDLGSLDCERSVLHVRNEVVDGADGTKVKPFSKLPDAITAARSNPDARLILVAGGDYRAVGDINIFDGVSVIGGYDPQGFVFDPEEHKTELLMTGRGAPALEGLIIENITEPTLVAHLTVRTTDGRAEHDYIAAVRVHNTRNVTLHSIDARAGNALNGLPGEDGDAGSDGADGGSAGQTVMGNVFTPPTNGIAADSPSCPNAKGGSGGLGGRANATASSESGQSGETSAGGALGGEGGYMDRIPQKPLGDDGANGTNGSTGPVGAPGTLEYMFDNRIWIHAGFGQPGHVGANGSGGGGGGGTASGGLANTPYAGGSGGAGGNGGCGGEGGDGGHPGQSSFGLLVSDNSSLRVFSSTFAAGNGGDGAIGGNGGAGGSAGQGGFGTRQTLDENGNPTVTFEGGNGGNGGLGGSGGNGGSGAGGFSIGALCDSKLSDSSGNEFVAGNAGSGAIGAPNGINNNERDCE